MLKKFFLFILPFLLLLLIWLLKGEFFDSPITSTLSPVDQNPSPKTAVLYQKQSHTIAARPPEKKELEDAQIDSTNLNTRAQFDQQWEKPLVDYLLSFQPAETKVIVSYQRQHEIAEQTGQKKQAIEVNISYMQNGQVTGGFTALVDSSNGKILKTWNRLRLHQKREFFELD